MQYLRKGNILIALLVSWMIIYLGPGVGVLHCLHHDTIQLALQHDCDEMPTGHHDCCKSKSECMKFSMLKLSPLNMAQKAYVDMSAHYSFVAIISELCSYFKQFPSHQAVSKYIPEDIEAPPRSYLSLIRVLLI